MLQSFCRRIILPPQEKEFNAGVWNDLEQQVRHWARKFGKVYVITGPFLPKKVKKENKLSYVEQDGDTIKSDTDDIMVAGFDDVNCATLVSPQLTTLRQPCAQIARHAVEMLIARIAAPDIPPRALFLSAPLVVRESTSGKTRRVKPKKGRGKEI